MGFIGNMDKKEFMSGFWRSCGIQGCFNYERQQGIGFGFSIIPHLKRIYRNDPDGLKEALKRHVTFYNITPQCTTFVQGIVISMEEEAARNKEFDPSSINAVKTALMGPISGIGDSIFWGTLRTIGLGIGLSFCMQANILGPIFFLLIHNVPHWYLRYNGLKIGYTQGLSFMENATEGGMLETFSQSAKILGATVVGCMISSMINFSTSITLNLGNYQTLAIQDIFDQIAPKLLPLSLAFMCFFFVRKGKKTTTVMLLLFLMAFVIAFLESLGIFMP